MRTTRLALIVLSTALLAACGGSRPPTQPSAPMAGSAAARSQELDRLQALLRDTAFAQTMASALDAAYYRGQGQTPPPFLKPEEMTATTAKSVREEKIAINLAGFYALETGAGYLAERDRQTPMDVLLAVADGRRSEADMLLLARFANATWKASQPFRSLARISRPNFIPAARLDAAELRKDFVQIRAAAAQLVQAMANVRYENSASQLARLQTVLRDSSYAQTMAQALDAAYYQGQGQPVPPFLKPEEMTATTPKSVREEKIATNLAGFYALEAGVGIIVERGGESPLQVIDGIAAGTRPAGDMLLLARLANATWKAGQPFRGLARIERETFKPAALLSPVDVEKDHAQIRAAAQRLAQAMRS